MNKGQIGTARELRVTLDLIEKGYEIFQGVGATSCDLIALKGSEIIRVEVKSAMRSGQCIGVPNVTQDTFDVIAAVTASGDIYYHQLRQCSLATTREGYVRIYYAQPGENGVRRKR